VNYALTDGFEILEVREFDREELKRERERAFKLTGGNLSWVPAIPPVAIPDDDVEGEAA